LSGVAIYRLSEFVVHGFSTYIMTEFSESHVYDICGFTFLIWACIVDENLMHMFFFSIRVLEYLKTLCAFPFLMTKEQNVF
jgi:hypothetical protein